MPSLAFGGQAAARGGESRSGIDRQERAEEGWFIGASAALVIAPEGLGNMGGFELQHLSEVFEEKLGQMD